MVEFLLGCGCPILVRPAGLLHALREREHPALIGDFSLNAANAVTAAELLGMGLERLTPAHDLNAAQVAELARNAGAERIEAVAYQHLPVFHTEHCVFCRFLSTGTSYLNCGRPCESHRVELRDSAGRAHPVMADVGCRNTVFGAEAQQAGAHLEAWREAGIRQFRLEFVARIRQPGDGSGRRFRGSLGGQVSATRTGRPLATPGAARDRRRQLVCVGGLSGAAGAAVKKRSACRTAAGLCRRSFGCHARPNSFRQRRWGGRTPPAKTGGGTRFGFVPSRVSSGEDATV